MDNKVDDLIRAEELADLYPFFGTKMGRWVAKGLIKIAKVDVLSDLHRDYIHLRGEEFTTAVLNDARINVAYTLHHKERLERVQERTFLTISNHPFGGLDGIMLLDIMLRIRPDYRVLVNGVLDRITTLAENWIPIQPRRNKKGYVHDAGKNISGVKLLAERISEGHPVGMFPAGGIAHYDFKKKERKEQLWQLNNVRIISTAQVPVVPIMFDGINSKLFYRLLKISYNLNTIRMPAEILNKKGQVFDVYVGEPIMPDEISAFKNLKELRTFLMERAFSVFPEKRG